MKKFTLLCILALSAIINSFAGEELPDSINNLINEAVYDMDNGDFDKSITLLKDITKKFPKNYAANYELAYAYFLKKDYNKSIGVLKKLQKNPSSSDLLFQLLGTAYDMTGNPDKALETYFKGLKKFPSSGRLYLEAGIVYNMHGEYDMAADCYEKGIEAEPGFPSNYFRAADLLCNSDEKVFGLMYGEIMINMQPESQRAGIMSKILFDTYKNAIKFPNDTTINVSFTKNHQIYFDEKTGSLNIPFETLYELTTSKIVPSAFMDNREINLKTLNKFRTLFIDDYSTIAESNTNLLFDYHKKIIEAGHFEAYNMWLLREGSPGEFDMWVNNNESKYVEFNKWYKENPLTVTSENRFSRKTANKMLLPGQKEK